MNELNNVDDLIDKYFRTGEWPIVIERYVGDYPPDTQEKMIEELAHSILDLITEQVRLGRIDELNHVMSGDNGAYWASDKSDMPDIELSIQERLAQLKDTTKEDK